MIQISVKMLIQGQLRLLIDIQLQIPLVQGILTDFVVYDWFIHDLMIDVFYEYLYAKLGTLIKIGTYINNQKWDLC